MIKAGDLVYIARGHSCTVNTYGGIPFLVKEVATSNGLQYKCPMCKEFVHEPAACVHGAGKWTYIPVTWVSRIPPLAELESTETKEVLHA